jgi:transketolase
MIGGFKMTANQQINNLKKIILELSYQIKEGHIASSFSIMDILYILYAKVINHNEDKFLLSKGHASLALYTILYHNGFITKEQLYSFCKYNSELGGHPKLNPKLGIHCSSGSLGHGMPIAIGMALSKKIQNQSGNIYFLIGDGESNEGTIWESALLASQHNLNNLYCIVDYNHSTDQTLNMKNLGYKFFAFNWDVEYIHGHNHLDLLTSLLKKSDKPKAIICETIKGYGCTTLEKSPNEWHHKSPSLDELNKLLEELYA